MKISPVGSIERKVENKLEDIVHEITHLYLHALAVKGTPTERVLQDSVNHCVDLLQQGLHSVSSMRVH